MSSYASLEKLRIGCVSYLNARPLIHCCHGSVVFDHPSRLAEMLSHGHLDVALVPVFTAFKIPDSLIVDGVAIASLGPVFSVFMAYNGDLTDVKSVSLDPASRTSCHLLQCLLAEFHDLRPKYSSSEEADAHLLIGNQAIEFREHAPAGTRFLDLGEEWLRRTGLPFVYALWLLRGGVAQACAVAEDFRRLKRAGLRRLDEIVRGEPGGFARRYLTEHIRFDLGEPEKQAMALFRELALKHGFIQPPIRPFDFV